MIDMKGKMAITFVVVLFVLVNLSQCQQYSKGVDLMTAVLTGYNPRQRPLLEQKDTLNVSVSLTVSSIRDLDEVEGKFSIVGILGMSWQDQIINWSPGSYGGASKIDLKLSDIWYPKLVLTNPFTKLKDVAEDWMFLSVTSTGEIYFRPVSVFEAICNVDVTYFPFDTQTCTLLFSEFGYTGSELALIPTGKVEVSSSLQSGQWDLLSVEVTRIPGSSLLMDRIQYTFTAKRKSLFLIINILMPIIVMTVLNIFVFILPADSGERLSFSVTMILALAVYMTIVGDNLPKSSEPMSILSYYLMGTLLVSSTITVLCIFNLEIYYRRGNVNNCLTSFARMMFTKSCKSKRKNTPIQVKVAFAEDEKSGYISPTSSSTSSTEDKEDISWHDVSFGLDRLCLLVITIANVTMNIVFLIILL